MTDSPVFITGANRSGSTLIARILSISGVWTGKVSTMMENNRLDIKMAQLISSNPLPEIMPSTENLFIPKNWKAKVEEILKEEGYTGKGLWMCKNSYLAQLWPIWNYAFPNAKWIIVRRRTGDIVQSCMKTGYMDFFKKLENREQFNIASEQDGWLHWVHLYEIKFREMIEAGLNCKTVWPERMVSGDYRQIYETLEWLNLPWSTEIVNLIDPLLWNTRQKERSKCNGKSNSN